MGFFGSRPILTKFFPPFSPLLTLPNASARSLTFKTRTFSKAFCSYLSSLTRFQPANSKHTAAQVEWLTGNFSSFLDHQAKKTTKRFFPTLYEDYFKIWPPTPTEEEITEAGDNLAVATAKVQESEETVRRFELTTLISR